MQTPLQVHLSDSFFFRVLVFKPETKRHEGDTMTFMPLEAEEKKIKSRHREMRWVSLEGKQSLEKMT